MRRLLGEMSRKFQIKFKYPGEEGERSSSDSAIKPEFISKSGFRENWNLMNSDNISSRFLKSLTSQMTFPVRTEPGAKDHEMVKIKSLEQIHLLSSPTLSWEGDH